MKHENQEDRKKNPRPDSRGINPHAPPER